MSKDKAENPDPLAQMIVEMHERIENLEQDRRVLNSLVRTLAHELGYELVTKEQDWGKIVASWERRSPLVGL